MDCSSGKESASRNNLDNHGKRAIHAWYVGVFDSQRAEAKRIRDDPAREKQEGIQGQWQLDSPFREILEQASRNEDMGCSSVMRKVNIAVRDSRWKDLKEECRVKGKSSEWPQEQYVKLTRRW